MAGTNLTWFFIGIGAFVLVVILGTQFYVDVMANNGGTIDSSYSAKYAQIAGYNSTLGNFEISLTQNRSVWSSIPTTLGNTFNVLAIGLSGINLFFGLLDIVPNMFLTIYNSLALPPIFWWFISLVLGIFIVTKVYKAIRGQAEEV